VPIRWCNCDKRIDFKASNLGVQKCNEIDSRLMKYEVLEDSTSTLRDKQLSGLQCDFSRSCARHQDESTNFYIVVKMGGTFVLL